MTSLVVSSSFFCLKSQPDKSEELVRKKFHVPIDFVTSLHLVKRNPYKNFFGSLGRILEKICDSYVARANGLAVSKSTLICRKQSQGRDSGHIII